MAERDLTVLPIRHTVAALHEVTTLLMGRHDVDEFVETYQRRPHRSPRRPARRPRPPSRPRPHEETAMTETASNVRSIQGEQQGSDSAKISFVGASAELSGELPRVGDEQEFRIRAVCKKGGKQLVDDSVVDFRQMKVLEILPGDITASEDLEDPSLMSRDDVSEG